MRKSFYAYMARLKLIRRWGLMRNTQEENDAEHSLQVAMIAHGIALIGKNRYGRDIDPEHALALAVYHDAAEVLTGDMPTPVKYTSPKLREAYGRVESEAEETLLSMLPEDMREPIGKCMTEKDTLERKVVKCADRISAYIKCLEEQRAGNREFDAASRSISEAIREMDLPEVHDFMREMIPSFLLTLDELNQEDNP